LANLPNYKDCSLGELYQALNLIKADQYPENFAALESEIDSRRSLSYNELLRCWSVLNRKAWPEHASRLARELEAARLREGISLEGPLPWMKYRTFWPRVLAALLDSLLFFIVTMSIVLLTTANEESISLDFGNGDTTIQILFLIYSVVFHAKYGQTIGKMLAAVRVVRVKDEEAISLRHAILRDIVPIVFVVLIGLLYLADLVVPGSAVTVGLAYTVIGLGVASFVWPFAEVITMLLNEKRRAIHDLIAGTVVIRV
jgi:uncharacterized RDD family membrane protein YckC